MVKSKDGKVKGSPLPAKNPGASLPKNNLDKGCFMLSL